MPIFLAVFTMYRYDFCKVLTAGILNELAKAILSAPDREFAVIIDRRVRNRAGNLIGNRRIVQNAGGGKAVGKGG